MIYAKQIHARQYLGIHPNLDTALLRMMEGLPQEPGSYEVDGDNVQLNCFTYTTLPPEGLPMESHDFHGDIHIIVSGEEGMTVGPLDGLIEFERDDSRDYIGYHGESQLVCPLRPGDFLVVFPADAHGVKLAIDAPMEVTKAVFKFAL